MLFVLAVELLQHCGYSLVQDHDRHLRGDTANATRRDGKLQGVGKGGGSSGHPC